MAIYKAVVHQNYAQIPNETLQDQSLSFEARGLLSMLLSMPHDWAINKEWLISQSDAGRDKVQRILNELVENRYLVKIQSKDSVGKFTSLDFFVYPFRQSVDGKAVDGKAVDGKPTTTKETVIQKKQDTKETLGASAKKPKTKAQQLFDQIRTESEVNACLNCLDDNLLTEWVKHRLSKKASFSNRALVTINNTLEELRTIHRIAPDKAIAAQLDSGWSTIKVEYLVKSTPSKAYSSPGSEHRGPDQPIHISQAHRELTDEERKKGSANMKQIQGLID